MLFPKGREPDSATMRAKCDNAGRIAVTHEMPANGERAAGFELLRDGMTFDLIGMAPGPSPAPLQSRHRYGVPEDLIETRKAALILRPGLHLEGGAYSLPVVRVMMDLACALARELDDLCALAWRPASSLVGVEFFCNSITHWIGGGPFPALGLTGLATAPDGGLQSEGLAYFIGQELRVEPELAEDKMLAAQLAVRLINQLVYEGRMEAPQQIVAHNGMRLLMAPSINKRFIRVRRA